MTFDIQELGSVWAEKGLCAVHFNLQMWSLNLEGSGKDCSEKVVLHVYDKVGAKKGMFITSIKDLFLSFSFSHPPSPLPPSSLPTSSDPAIYPASLPFNDTNNDDNSNDDDDNDNIYNNNAILAINLPKCRN